MTTASDVGVNLMTSESSTCVCPRVDIISAPTLYPQALLNVVILTLPDSSTSVYPRITQLLLEKRIQHFTSRGCPRGRRAEAYCAHFWGVTLRCSQADTS